MNLKSNSLDHVARCDRLLAEIDATYACIALANKSVFMSIDVPFFQKSLNRLKRQLDKICQERFNG